jgi:transposase-like protein
MKLHANAPLGPKGRATMVRRVLEEGVALTEAAEAAGVSARTAGKWVRRYREQGETGLLDRSSAPRRASTTSLRPGGWRRSPPCAACG